MRRVAELSYAAVVRREFKAPPKPIVMTDWEFERYYYAEKRRKNKEEKLRRQHSDEMSRQSDSFIRLAIKSDT